MNKPAIAFVILLLFWALLFLLTGTLTSGYHFTDDHEILTINKNIHDNGLIKAVISVISDDFKIRFRPFYYLNRVILTGLFGQNFLLWSLYTALLSVFTSFFLFLFLRRLGYTFLNALIFPFLTLIGPQSSIWWRLGPNETIGFFLLSASLLLLANSVFSKNKFYLFVSVLLLILSSLSKESFILFMPAFVLLRMVFQIQQDKGKSLKYVVYENIPLVILLSSVFILEVYLIKFKIGTNQIGYAGIDNSFTVAGFIKFVSGFLAKNISVWLILIGLLLHVMFLKPRIMAGDFFSAGYKLELLHVAVLLAITIPQFILYYKSGLTERYLLPLNLGFSFFILFLVRRINDNPNIHLYFKKSYVIIIALACVYCLRTQTLPNAISFTQEGKSTNAFLSSITSQTSENDSLLVVLNGFENYEWGHSIYSYLTLKSDRKNIFFLPAKQPLEDDFERSLDADFSNKFSPLISIEITPDFACVAVMPFNTNQKIKSRLSADTCYEKNEFDIFTVYARKR